MIHYITRRLLLFIPTLFAISLLAFLMSINAPGDPVERMVSVSAGDGLSPLSVGEAKQKIFWRKKLGLDLPAFYFSIRCLSEPELHHQILNEGERASIKRISRITGNASGTMHFHAERKNLIDKFNKTDNNLNDSIIVLIHPELLTLKYASNSEEIHRRLNKIHELALKLGQPEFTNAVDETRSAYQSLLSNTSIWKNYIPTVNFHPNNQYHRWVFGDGNWLTGNNAVNTRGIIRGDFGISYQTRQPVSTVISEKIFWSLFLSVLSIILAYIVSVPVGIWAGANKNSTFDKSSSLVLFILYSMPAFWVATLLLMIFANPDIMQWFPASGVKPATGYPEHATLFAKIKLSLPYLVLPLICYSYSSFAFISRTIRVSMIDTMTQDYIRTANAKGLPFAKVVFKHAFRNSLLPLITIFSNIFPRAIGGSVILETIFSIPGMGFELFQSIQNQNYPMVIALFTITGALTIFGYLVGDILYTIADPRISFARKP